MNLKKISILLVVTAAVLAFFLLDLGRYLSLDFVKQSQRQFSQLFAQNPVTVTTVFFAAYVAVTGLSLPGAAIMTLAAGAAFGLVLGIVVVSFASTIGATLAMLVSRYLLRDTIEARFGRRLSEVNQGIEREGAFYLFSLRLIPAIPFFALNLLMGLTRMKTWTYFWVSQVGMLAGTAVFVYAGTELAKIDSLRSVLSPRLIAAFVLLGILPLITRKVVDILRRRKVFARWKAQRPATFERNLVVIGAGAGGLVAALIAATVKAKVTLVESHKMGGDCLNYGCVPSKALIRTAKLHHQIRHAERYGLADASAQVRLPQMMARIKQVIADIAPHDSIERYTAMGVDVQKGHATIVNPWTVEIKADDGSIRRVTTRNIVIAAGARPFVPLSLIHI